MDLFDHNIQDQIKKEAPLAARMRPRTLEEFVGQEHIIGTGKVLRRAIESGQLPSIILWGPPGSGKTTLSNIIANSTHSHFSPVSAVSAGVADLRKIIEEAKERRKLYQQKTILFIDEIHRFNKGQQDAILPFVEDGTVTLIGATTENPSFEVNTPLLSRSRVFVLNPLTDNEIRLIVERALKDKERGLGEMKIILSEEALKHLCIMAGSDARTALNALEMAALVTPPDNKGNKIITLDIIEDAFQHRALRYDRAGEEHYDLISALHKCMRDSDPDASLYWLGRMIEAGEDPLYVARRMVRFAAEDVGMADPQALGVALWSMEAFHFMGLPEGELALAEAAVYLATAPKSNTLYGAYDRAKKDVAEKGALPVPLHIRNAPTRLMKDLGYGRGYKYAHDFPGGIVPQDHFPEELGTRTYYHPTDRGFEKIVGQRLEAWRKKLGRKS